MSATDKPGSVAARREQALTEHLRRAASTPDDGKLLLQAWTDATDAEWLALIQRLMLERDHCTWNMLQHALQAHPRSTALRQAQAGLLLQRGDARAAEELLRALLAEPSAQLASSFTLARLLKGQGRMRAVADVMRGAFPASGGDLEQRIQAIELLDDCGRKHDAADLAEVEIAAGNADPRLHAYAGMLQAQLGRFDVARERYAFVAANSPQAPDWHVPQGLAGLQRYADAGHPDFALFRRYLAAPLNDDARTSLLFALGKAHDDIGEYAQAAHFLRDANARAAAKAHWSRKRWARSIEVRRKRRLPAVTLEPEPGWTPVFIVGVPRSGTTLVARQLAEHALVCHRGESPWLPALAERIDGTEGGDYRQRLADAAATYAAQLRQDDAPAARWFIDKQPRNFLHVDLILSLFPNARIIQCQRRARDIALSLWMQSFHDRSLDFSCDFADIAAYIRGARQLMAGWQARYPHAVRTIRYEELTADPTTCLAGLTQWLGLPLSRVARTDDDHAISTASLWQARQPVHTHSVDRWRCYAPFLPELMQIAED